MSKEISNEAAMREALEKLYEQICYGETERNVVANRQMILDALSAPPRNCDKFPGVDVAYERFRSYVAQENPSFTKASPLHTVWDALKWVLSKSEKKADA